MRAEQIVEVPSSIVSEQNVLGSILLAREDALMEVVDILRAEHFYRKAHGKLYAVILDLFQRREPIDYVSITNELARGNGSAPPINLSELLDATPVPFNILHHAREVIRMAECRKGILLGQKYVAAFYEKPANVTALVGEMATELLQIAERGRRTSPSPRDILLELKARDRSRVTRLGLTRFDMLLSGMEPSHLWAIGGFSSTGKTAFALQIMLDLLQQGKRCGYFSLEMSRHQLMVRILANLANVPMWRIEEGGSTLDEHEAIAEWEDWIAQKEGSLWMYDDVYQLSEIGYLCRRHQMQNGLDVVFIDFLQNLRGGQSKEYDRLSDAIIELQQLAKQLDCTIVVLSQISNEQAATGMGTSDAYSFKGAGTIRDAADKAIMLTRDRKADIGHDVGLLKANVMKNRQGALGEVMLHFQFATGRIIEAPRG